LIIMVLAVVIAVGFMILFAGKISNFVDKHPTIKILALSFLLLIGFTLVADGFGQHISKGYIYFAMAFSVFVELINMKMRKRQPVNLRQRYSKTEHA
jgi:predicted tellurium resistance membrane protein TerC